MSNLNICPECGARTERFESASYYMEWDACTKSSCGWRDRAKPIPLDRR